ncbi:MAG TPA: histidinol-phosphate transaminase [Symbiobacteriaceae bacterium]|nr:histidinol-phosphate transaminase [Symbiobacteriaceae bacterium]
MGPTPRPELSRLQPYVPGRPIRDVQESYGLTQVVKLASNENPLGPSPLAVVAMQEALASAHLYPEATAPLVRTALAQRFGLDPDWLLVGNGSDSIIRLLCLAYVQPGDRVVVPGCSFPSYRNFALTSGAEVIEVPLVDEAMDLRQMAVASLQGAPARVVFLCRPNNPTGAVFPEDAFREFLAQVPPTTLVVVDEAYKEYDTTAFDSLGLLQAHPNLVLLRTFSKIYGLGGVRIGYGLAHPAIWKPCLTVREPFAVSNLAQAAALGALADDGHVTRSRQVNEAGKLALQAACAELGLTWAPTEANFLFIDLGRQVGPINEALLTRGVIVRPVGGRPTCIRVTIGLPEENHLFIQALQAILSSGLY